MKYLIHLKCEQCGWRWSIYAKSFIEALNCIAEDGCPKECDQMGMILVLGHEEVGQSDLAEIFGQGLGAAVFF